MEIRRGGGGRSIVSVYCEGVKQRGCTLERDSYKPRKKDNNGGSFNGEGVFWGVLLQSL